MDGNWMDDVTAEDAMDETETELFDHDGPWIGTFSLFDHLDKDNLDVHVVGNPFGFLELQWFHFAGVKTTIVQV